MVEDVAGAVRRLSQSSLWRIAAMTALVGGYLFFAGHGVHRGCPDEAARCDAPPPAPAPTNPQRQPGTPPLAQPLGSFRMAYQRIQSEYQAGDMGKAGRCERISKAYDDVPDDLKESADARVKQELDEGRACQQSLSASDKRFEAFASIVSQADAIADRGAIDAVASAMQSFDDFDKSRKQFAEARRQADHFLAMAQKVEKKFATLQSSLEQAAQGGEATQLALVQALETIEPADEKLATADQKELLLKARHSIAQFAASQLSTALKALDSERSSTNYQRVVSLYRTIKSYPPDGTPLDASVLKAAQDAENEVLESDNRLKALSEAGDAWRKRHNAETCAALDHSMGALTALDRSRITGAAHSDVESKAAQTEHQAQKDDFILHGQKYWNDIEMRKKIPIIFRGNNESTTSIIRDAFIALGYITVSDPELAAVKIEITISDVAICARVTEGLLKRYCAGVKVDEMSWTCGGDMEYASNYMGPLTPDEDLAKDLAVKNFISSFASALGK